MRPFTSPRAITALRNSTKVDTGKGPSVQIDHQSNFSFDYGNAHILFLDANPHLFDDNSPGGNAFNTPPPTFVPYPTALGQWVMQDPRFQQAAVEDRRLPSARLHFRRRNPRQ